MYERWKDWARGMLESILDRFEGVDAEIFALQQKLRSGDVRLRSGLKGLAPGERGSRRNSAKHKTA